MATPSTTRAVLWMCGWLASMLFMTLCGREVVSELQVNMLMFFRAAIGVAIVGTIAFWSGTNVLASPQPLRHTVRTTVHFCAQYAWFYALSLIALAQVISLEFTMPLWVIIVAAIYLGERITSRKILAGIIGFAGILLIVRPDFGGAGINTGQAWALASAIGFAISVVMTKRLLEKDSALTTLFYMLSVQLILGAVVAVFFWQWPQPHLWPWIIGAGVAGVTSHFSLASALENADASLISQLDFARVPLTAVLGYLAYNELVDIYLAAGAGLILLGNLINIRK